MRKILLLILIPILLVGCSNEESKARDTVEKYLKALKMGEDVDLYLDTREGLIDVFDWEYLRSLEVDQIKDTRSYDREYYEMFEKDFFDTFDDFKENEIEWFSRSHDNFEIIENSYDRLELWDGESYIDNHKFLYNVELANELGQKLFKKVEFYVEFDHIYYNGDFIKGYVIKDIFIR